MPAFSESFKSSKCGIYQGGIQWDNVRRHFLHKHHEIRDGIGTKAAQDDHFGF